MIEPTPTFYHGAGVATCDSFPPLNFSRAIRMPGRTRLPLGVEVDISRERMTLTSGDRVLIPDDVYGGTYRLFSKVLSQVGIEWATVDMTDLEAKLQEARGARFRPSRRGDTMPRPARSGSR